MAGTDDYVSMHWQERDRLYALQALADTLAAAAPAAHKTARLEGYHATDDRDWDTEDYGYANCQDELCAAARAYRAAR